MDTIHCSAMYQLRYLALYLSWERERGKVGGFQKLTTLQHNEIIRYKLDIWGGVRNCLILIN